MNKAATWNYRGNITWQAGHVAAGIVQHCDPKETIVSTGQLDG